MSADEKRIREFAYQIWESEGQPTGQEERHWEMARKLAEAEALAPDKSTARKSSKPKLPEVDGAKAPGNAAKATVKAASLPKPTAAAKPVAAKPKAAAKSKSNSADAQAVPAAQAEQPEQSVKPAAKKSRKPSAS